MNRGVLLAALVLLVGAGPRAHAADAPAPEAATKARLAALRARVTEWCEARKQLHKDKCPTCQGFGQVQDLRTKAYATCPKCDGRRLVLNPKAFRKIHYDLKTDAWKQRPESRDEATNAYRAADAGAPRPVLGAYKIDRVELVGTRLGRAWVIEGTDTVARASRWVGVADPATKKEGWYVFSEETDGPWDESPLPPPPPTVPSEDVPRIEPLTDAEAAAVRAMLERAGTHQGLECAQQDGRAVVLTFFDATANGVDALDEGIARSAYPLLRVAFEAVPSMPAAKLVFLAKWRDRYGAVEKRPYRTVEAKRAQFERIQPQNLTRAEILALFTILDAGHEGLVLWWK